MLLGGSLWVDGFFVATAKTSCTLGIRYRLCHGMGTEGYSPWIAFDSAVVPEDECPKSKKSGSDGFSPY
jgi:hypothetical protein